MLILFSKMGYFPSQFICHLSYSFTSLWLSLYIKLPDLIWKKTWSSILSEFSSWEDEVCRPKLPELFVSRFFLVQLLSLIRLLFLIQLFSLIQLLSLLWSEIWFNLRPSPAALRWKQKTTTGGVAIGGTGGPGQLISFCATEVVFVAEKVSENMWNLSNY